MNITDGLHELWNSTGIMGFIHTAQNALADPTLEGFEQILHMHGQWIMILICLFLLWLGIKKQFEPLLLVPIAFGGLLSNIPMPLGEEIAGPNGFLGIIFEAGIHKGLFPLIIFMGVGAMTDFGPLIANPKTALLGGAAQFGIFGALLMAYCIFGFTMPEAASIGIIGGADGPTSIFIASKMAPEFLGAIALAGYSYMALVPVIQPPIIKLLTTRKERLIRMAPPKPVSKRLRVMFPIIAFIFVGCVDPGSIVLLGMLFFGNLLRESGVTDRLAKTARTSFIDIVTIILGLTVGASTDATKFLTPDSLKIFGMGAAAFCVATASGVLFAKFMNLFTKNKINPIIGAAGVSAVPLAARVCQVVGAKEDPSNFLIMHAMAPNVAGCIGSAVVAGVFLTTIL